MTKVISDILSFITIRTHPFQGVILGHYNQVDDIIGLEEIQNKYPVSFNKIKYKLVIEQNHPEFDSYCLFYICHQRWTYSHFSFFHNDIFRLFLF